MLQNAINRIPNRATYLFIWNVPNGSKTNQNKQNYTLIINYLDRQSHPETKKKFDVPNKVHFFDIT
ncbi:hypothetical protein HYN43_013145 [Mucilaginibacter celer]|uniref:Uncharacterized protein n=1 Tax=Mucilaginibacter celer TaxID=2305508 RepID=A0A494VQG1_9SPHI|nr:hypothetical protein HYN43_013145 [Mucilaginibacter celer]